MAPSLAPRNLGAEVIFTINGQKYSVSDNVPADTSLNTYIREYAHLKGTKFMCLEGGCGACIVSVLAIHPKTNEEIIHAVNSCLVPIFSCHGWSITTVEGLGSKKKGYNKIVKRLAASNGTQCGYCSPGMVMNMYSLLKSNPEITMKEVENSFGGNICRCTGYRPILDGFKSLAIDAPEKLVAKLVDIEDMICPNSGEHCSKDGCSNTCSREKIEPNLSGLELQLSGGAFWYQPSSIKEIFEILDKIGDLSYRYVGGNTGQGVYRIEESPDVFINLNGVPELLGCEITSNGIILGANIQLTEAMNTFYKVAKDYPERFSYCKVLGDHIDLIANVPVRNVGTFAGNLSLKHEHKEFPSDIFIFLEMVGAKLVIANSYEESVTKSLMDYLKMDMKKKLILKILLPNLDAENYLTNSYKIMPRAQNAHAYVNAGFRVKVDRSRKFLITEKPTIVFGGVDPTFMHALKTEEYLNGKELLDDATMKNAFEILESEIRPDHILPDSSPEYRRGLAVSLFYKFVLSLSPGQLSKNLKSGGPILERPLSTGIQDYQTDSKVWPLNKPIPKIEALIQCSGEAEYTNDMPSMPGELWGQLVLTDRANAYISNIDPSEALNMPGVIRFLTARDIPGKNTFCLRDQFGSADEAIFAEGHSLYAGQAVGVILAESNALAIKAAKKVKIEYSGQKKVMTDVREIIKDNIKERIKKCSEMKATDKGDDIKYSMSGTLELKGQYHFTMETHTCIAVPTEDHLEVYAASQWPSSLQETISVALNIPENYVDIRVRRLGGGYGAKISRSNHVGVIASLAAHILHRPVRIVLNLEANAECYGKRIPVFCNYNVSVNKKGEIQTLNASIYEDDGCSYNDSPLAFGATFSHMKSGYDSSRWQIEGYGVITDTASNTWCRAPGSTEGIAFIENVMEHISKVTGLDPTSVRLANFDKEDTILISMINDLRKSSDYDNRVLQIEEFNKLNRWKKRGISLVPMNYPLKHFGNFYGMVSIFGLDGTVAITHGAIEMGQGVNTKAAQVAAHILGVPHEMITVKPTTTLTAPNNICTGGSLGSESVCYAIKVCCEQLNERLKPVREKLGNKASWKEICNAAARQYINLNYTYMFTDKDVSGYSIYGVTVTEVEVDILTGQYHTRRVDILEDAGQSLSPDVDVGQVEGAFIMGLGYYTSEELVYNPETGRLLTNRTWNYKPPGIKDIPIDFRITLRKNSSNPNGVLRSKATGEPPLCMSCSVLFAIRNAIFSARKDSGNNAFWFDIQPPFTAEKIWLGALTKKEMFSI